MTDNKYIETEFFRKTRFLKRKDKMRVKTTTVFSLILILSLLICYSAFSASIFTVVGAVRNADDTLVATDLEVVVSNETKKLTVTTTLGKEETGLYGVVFIDMENNAVAALGDVLKVTVKDAQDILGSQTYEITADDIAKSLAIVDVKFVLEDLPPVASLTYHPSLEEFLSGQEIIFDASGSIAPDGDIVSYEWDFDDGETAEGSIVKHRFRGAMSQPKTYNVTLKVEDKGKVTNSETVSITVIPLEKTVEVSHQPIIPVPGQSVFAKMTASYNWLHDDTYIVSQIHCECSGFLGVGTVSIWDFLSDSLPMPIWTENIFCSKEREKTYSPKLHQVLYGGDTFEGIRVDAFDAMNICITGWAGMNISAGPSIPMPFFETNSVCFQPDFTEVPDVPIDIQDWDLAQLCSPGELRVYDSEKRVTGLVSGEIKEEIPNSIYNDESKTVVMFSPSDTYRYEVVGTDEGKYGLTIASVKDGKATTFTATEVPTSTNATHQYAVDWSVVSKGEEGVIVQIDSDGDGTFEKTINTGATFTTEEEYSLDINSDGIVDISDLVIVGQHFGESSSSDLKADVNKDGTVDILDLILVGQNFGTQK